MFLERLTCFLSHKCNDQSHSVALRLRTALEPFGIALLRDPFEPGEDVLVKIDTQVFHSFVFLLSPESWASTICQHELKTAQIRGVPIITVLLDDTIPAAELRSRIWIDARANTGGNSDAILQTLCTTVVAHARAGCAVHALGPENAPEETRRSAQFLWDEVDAVLIAEHLQHIAKFYRPDTDILTRYWIALAVGKVGSVAASAVLDGFGWEDEPLPQEGIRQARDILSRSGLMAH